MLNFGPFKSFLFTTYISNNENPPITDKICWSLDIRYCEAYLYVFLIFKVIDYFSVSYVGITMKLRKHRLNVAATFSHGAVKREKLLKKDKKIMKTGKTKILTPVCYL